MSSAEHRHSHPSPRPVTDPQLIFPQNPSLDEAGGITGDPLTRGHQSGSHRIPGGFNVSRSLRTRSGQPVQALAPHSKTVSPALIPRLPTQPPGRALTVPPTASASPPTFKPAGGPGRAAARWGKRRHRGPGPALRPPSAQPPTLVGVLVRLMLLVFLAHGGGGPARPG